MSSVEFVQSNKPKTILVVDGYEFTTKEKIRLPQSVIERNIRHSAAEPLQLRLASS